MLRVVSGAVAAVPDAAALAELVGGLKVLRRLPVRAEEALPEAPLTREALAYLRSELDSVLPKVIDRVVADLPAPGEREAVASPGALRARLEVLQAVLRSTLLPDAQRAALQQRLVDRIAHAGIFYHRHMIDRLEKDESVDVRNVSFDQLRLDIILWLLEDLGARAAADSVRSLAQVTARAALCRASQVIDAYIRTRGPAQRFDVAVVVSQVEELGVLVARVLESVSHDGHGLDSQGTLSRRLVEDFIHRCGLLVLATFRDLDQRHAAGRLDVVGLKGALKQIHALRAFVHRIDAPGGTRIRLAVDRTITRRAEATVRLVTARAAAHPEEAKAMLRDLAAFLAEAEAKAAGQPT